MLVPAVPAQELILYPRRISLLAVFLRFPPQIQTFRQIFFKTSLTFVLKRLSGYCRKEDYLRDLWSKFQSFLTLLARVTMFSFKRDYSAHPPSFSVTLLSHSNSLIIAPKQCGLVKFCFNTVKEGEIWGIEEKKSSLNSHAF